MGNGDSGIDARASHAGSGVHSGYSVDHGSASRAADAAAVEIPKISTASTAVDDAIAAAENALPTAFGDAIARLRSLRHDHVADVSTVHTFADGCLQSVRGCLAVYETTSAEQAAATARAEKQLVFDHPSMFGMAEASINRGLDGVTSPLGSEEAYRNETTGSHTTTVHDDGVSSTTTLGRTLVDAGSSETATYSRTDADRGGVVSSEQTYTASSTRNGVTDTLSYYEGIAVRPYRSETMVPR